MAGMIIKEKAYKLLHEKYKRLYTIIRTRTQNVLEYGQREDAVKFLQTIVDEDTHDLTGIISKTDKEVLEVLEYLVDDDEPVR
jgi:hypothetical protein